MTSQRGWRRRCAGAGLVARKPGRGVASRQEPEERNPAASLVAPLLKRPAAVREWQPIPVFLPGESQGQGEPGGLPSMGLHRVGHDRSDLAAAAAAVRETWVPSLGWEDPLEKGIVTHYSVLAWRIPWTEEPGGLWVTPGF